MTVKTILCALAILEIVGGSPIFAADGYANINGTTTGGSGGPTVTVTNAADFAKYARTNVPYVVQVDGVIITNIVSLRSDKTIIGLGTNATFIGRLNLSNGSNVVFRNLFITNPTNGSSADGITIDSNTHHVWVDHCTFFDCGDGELDISTAADFVTVSWCKFLYTTNTGHNFVNLIGASDSDTNDLGKLRVTFHHNWWSTLCVERMPRVRFGRVHVYNNYFNASVSNNIVNSYCVAAGIQSEVLVEKNVFERVDEPYRYQSPAGLLRAVSNATINCTGVGSFNDAIFTPPYSYAMDDTNLVAGIVTNNAGAGRLPLADFTANPTNGTPPLTVTFTDASTGMSPLNLFWDLGDGTTTNTADGASFMHTYSTAGTYAVTLTASNFVGASTLVSNNLIMVITALQAWQLQYFGCTNCAAADPDADPDGDGMSNSNEFLTGTAPTNALSALRIISVLPQEDDIAVTWNTAGGRTNAVQATSGDGASGYSNDFADISGPVIITGSGDRTTNYVDSGGATNIPARYYRVRLVP